MIQNQVIDLEKVTTGNLKVMPDPLPIVGSECWSITRWMMFLSDGLFEITVHGRQLFMQNLDVSHLIACQTPLESVGAMQSHVAALHDSKDGLVMDRSSIALCCSALEEVQSAPGLQLSMNANARNPAKRC